MASYLTILSARAARQPGATALMLPVYDNSDDKRQLPDEWRTVSYGELWDDVECAARWFTAQFAVEDIDLGSVVALWVSGLTYSDIVHLFALSLGGFIPLILSLNPSVDKERAQAWHLMRYVDAKAVVYDPQLVGREHILSAPISAPRYATVDFESLILDRIARAVSFPPIRGGSKLAFVMHTSPNTSTSASPQQLKPIAVTHQLTVAPAFTTRFRHSLVTTRIGSLTKYEGLSELLRVMLVGGCTVLPSSIKVSVLEVRDIVQRCKANALAVESASLANVLMSSWSDRELLRSLKDMHYIMSSGPPLPKFASQWISQTGFNIINTRVSAENVPEFTAMLPRTGVSAR